MCVPVSNTVDTRHIWLDWIIWFLQIIICVHGVRQWQSQKFYKYWAKSQCCTEKSQFCPKLTPKISKKFGRARASVRALSPPLVSVSYLVSLSVFMLHSSSLVFDFRCWGLWPKLHQYFNKWLQTCIIVLKLYWF